MPVESFFNDRVTLLDALQTALTAQLQQSLEHAGQATLFLSGGASPVPLYQRLASAPLPWQRIAVALVDERWVEPDHEASNEGLLRTNLLRGAAAACSFTGMKNAHSLTKDAQHIEAAVKQCNAHYARLPRPWSAALLGMGPDGHVASLFAGAPELPQALQAHQYCAAIHAPRTEVTGPHTARMTMTPWALFQCEQLFLFFTGDDKRARYEEAKATGSTLPVSHFLQQTTAPLHVFWCP